MQTKDFENEENTKDKSSVLFFFQTRKVKDLSPTSDIPNPGY
ncbi:MAG TPA: hypothetical protein VER14_07555 [Phototrophicaceae bacterium]|nr:hypothetical protein [Phototrophicaceae bacterium]